MRNFRELKIWQKGMSIVVEVYRLTALLPPDEKYGISLQLKRAAVSIPSNVAEGCSRNTERDFERFLHVAMGSANELETQLTIVRHLGLITKEKLDPILMMISEEQKMLNSFILTAKKRSPKT